MMSAAKCKKHFKQLLIHFLLFLFVVFSLFPLYWLLTTSLKPSGDVFSTDMLGFFEVSYENYETVLFKDKFPNYLKNSALISILTVAVTLPIGSTINPRKVVRSFHISYWPSNFCFVILCRPCPSSRNMLHIRSSKLLR